MTSDLLAPVWQGFLPLVASAELGRDPVRVRTTFGEAFVLYRDAAGTPALLSDRCPHRFASLSDGRVRSDGRIACPYHGWHFDHAGCGKSPTQPERTDCDTLACVVVERDGVIWAAPPGFNGAAVTEDANLPPVSRWTRRTARGLLRKRPKDPDELSFPVTVSSKVARYRSFVVQERIAETDDIVSWVLVPKDKGPVPHHQPGQHVSIEVAIQMRKLVRSYSLSAPANGESFRISIRRIRGDQPGIASNHLHEHLQVGTELAISAPAGEFCLSGDTRPTVFVAAGVGITPLFCMLKSQEARTLPSWLFYGVRTPADVFRVNELRDLATRGVKVRIFVSGSWDSSIADDDGISWTHGRIDATALSELAAQDPDIFLCGPETMMTSLEQALSARGFGRIHSERFVRSKAVSEAAQALRPAKVTFQKSKRELTWSADAGTLLELATSAGLALDSGCEVGSCSTCKVRVIDGNFLTVGKAREAENKSSCLLCVSVPKGDMVLDA
jgi:uncharacterized protein